MSYLRIRILACLTTSVENIDYMRSVFLLFLFLLAPLLHASELSQFITEHKWPEVILLIRGQMKDHPVSTPLKMELARAYFYAGRRVEAIHFLHEEAAGAGVNPEDRQAFGRRAKVIARTFLQQETAQLYQDAVELMQTVRIGEVRAMLEKCLKKEPNHFLVLTALAKLNLEREVDTDTAYEQVRAAMLLDSDEAQTQLLMARASFLRGELTDSHELFLQIERKLSTFSQAEADVFWAWNFEQQQKLGIPFLQIQKKFNQLTHNDSQHLRLRLSFAHVANAVGQNAVALQVLHHIEQQMRHFIPRYFGEADALRNSMTQLKSKIQSTQLSSKT